MRSSSEKPVGWAKCSAPQLPLRFRGVILPQQPSLVQNCTGLPSGPSIRAGGWQVNAKPPLKNSSTKPFSGRGKLAGSSSAPVQSGPAVPDKLVV